MSRPARLERLYDLVSGDEDARVCRDIPPESCVDQPRNFFAYLAANTLNKIADELTSARLVLPWMLGALGAPAAFTGFLVPVREAGVLLPQMAVAAMVRRMPRRQPVWLVGGLLSALALAGIAATATWLDGVVAGWAILGLLVVFSLARGLCSVSAKDVLGKTVSKSRRGRLMGWSAALGGALTLPVGVWLAAAGPGEGGVGLYAGLFVVAAAVWLLSVVMFALIREAPGATEGGGNALAVAIGNLRLLIDDAPFRAFVAARSALLAVALLPPFLVLFAQQSAVGGGGLGSLIVASGLAAAISSPFWGVLGDRSSRVVMALGAAGAGLVGLAVVAAAVSRQPWLASVWPHALFFLLLTVMHGGVRIGRKVYLVDMADPQTRAAYVAVSNSVIGVVMLVGGLVGVLGDLLGVLPVIALLSILSLLAGAFALRLPEVTA